MAEYKIDIEKSAQNILSKIQKRFGISAERLVELASAERDGRVMVLTAQAGEPLTLERLREVPHGEIKVRTLQSICDRANEIARISAHIDREAWTTEWVPMTDDDGCTWYECSKCECEFDLDSLDDKPAFCPGCGRATTPEAWAELEKRLSSR